MARGGELVGEMYPGPVHIEGIYFAGRRIGKFVMSIWGPWGAGILIDALGSLRVDTDGTRTPKCHADYYPFGEPAGSACTIYDNLLFAGLFRDGTYEDGGHSVAHRRYSNTYYHWFPPGPGGMKVVILANPQTWNMYGYAGDNPVTFNGPSGAV